MCVCDGLGFCKCGCGLYLGRAKGIPGLRDNNIVYGLMGLPEPRQADTHDHWKGFWPARVRYDMDTIWIYMIRTSRWFVF